MFTHLGEKFSCFGAFAKLRKATISFAMFVRLSVCLSARLHATTRIPLHGFVSNLISIFRKQVQKIQAPLTSDKKTDTLHEDKIYIYGSFLLIMRHVSDKPVEKIKTHYFMFNNFIFFENRALYEM